jgi:hypothetical protein
MIEILKISLITFMFTILGEKGRIFHFYQKAISGLPDWLRKPLGGCFLCMTGQVCLLYYPIVYWNEYNIVDHLFFCSVGIAATIVYNKIYEIIW